MLISCLRVVAAQQVSCVMRLMFRPSARVVGLKESLTVAREKCVQPFNYNSLVGSKQALLYTATTRNWSTGTGTGTTVHLPSPVSLCFPFHFVSRCTKVYTVLDLIYQHNVTTCSINTALS